MGGAMTIRFLIALYRDVLRLSHIVELAVNNVLQIDSGNDIEADSMRCREQSIQERRDGITEQDAQGEADKG